MQFGKVANPEQIDFDLPIDHPSTKKVLERNKNNHFKIHVGCAKWNRQDLKSFYPRGIKDELKYYATQFNSIELNATFYKNYDAAQYYKWYEKTPIDFKFFPKLIQNISHFKRLNEEAQIYVDNFLENVITLEEKLHTVFLQMHSNFSPTYFDRVVKFIEKWPKEIALAIEFRHTDWFNDTTISNELYDILENYNVTNIITDTAGRRDLLHMKLTTGNAFIRYVGANHKSDYKRLDNWINRIELWKSNGINEVNFFVHQNLEVESPLLAKYFIKKINEKLKLDLKVPNSLEQTELTLF